MLLSIQWLKSIPRNTVDAASPENSRLQQEANAAGLPIGQRPSRVQIGFGRPSRNSRRPASDRSVPGEAGRASGRTVAGWLAGRQRKGRLDLSVLCCVCGQQSLMLYCLRGGSDGVSLIYDDGFMDAIAAAAAEEEAEAEAERKTTTTTTPSDEFQQRLHHL